MSEWFTRFFFRQAPMMNEKKEKRNERERRKIRLVSGFVIRSLNRFLFSYKKKKEKRENHLSTVENSLSKLARCANSSFDDFLRSSSRVSFNKRFDFYILFFFASLDVTRKKKMICKGLSSLSFLFHWSPFLFLWLFCFWKRFCSTFELVEEEKPDEIISRV